MCNKHVKSDVYPQYMKAVPPKALINDIEAAGHNYFGHYNVHCIMTTYNRINTLFSSFEAPIVTIRSLRSTKHHMPLVRFLASEIIA